MARKNKRSQVRKPQRGGAGAARAARPGGIPPTVPGAAASPEAGAAPAAPAGSSPAAPGRMTQRPLPRARGRQQAGALPAEDATIPLERVPYFRADVRRIAITAAAMFVLLIIGSLMLRNSLGA